MPPQGQGQQGQSDGSLDLFWIMALVVIAIIGIWFFGKNYIITFIVLIKHAQLVVIQSCMIAWSKLLTTLGFPPVNFSTMNELLGFSKISTSEITFNMLVTYLTLVGKYYCYPVALLMIALGTWTLFSHAGAKYKNRYNMKRLWLNEQQLFPQTIAVSGKDLINQDLDEGPWAMAATPAKYAEKMGVIHKKKVGGVLKFVIEPKLTRQVFALQMGRRWDHLDKMPLYIKAIIATLLAKANDDDAGDELAEQISRSAQGNRLDFSGTQKLLIKYKDDAVLVDSVNAHAYILTVMATLFEKARYTGVIATSEFLWLKPVNRKLWYMLSSVGRQTSFIEVSGPFSHWIAEKKMGRKLLVPNINQAVTGLEEVINGILLD